MNNRKKHLLIPVSLCERVIRQKLWREFQVWIFILNSCDGSICLSRTKRESIANKLGLTERTVRNTITSLYARNWIGFNKDNDISYPRSIDVVIMIEKLKGAESYWMRANKIKESRQFLISAFISHLAREKQKQLILKISERGRINGRIKRTAFQVCRRVPLSKTALAAILNIPITTAHRFKRLAKESKLIQVTSNSKPLLINGKSIPNNQIKTFRKELGYKYYSCKKDGIIKERLPDLIRSRMSRKKRRKRKIH